MRPLRRPAPRRSAVFKSNLANAARAVVDAGVSRLTGENHEPEDADRSCPARGFAAEIMFNCQVLGALQRI